MQPPSSPPEKPRVLLLGSGILGWRLLRALIACSSCTLVGAIPWSCGPGRRSDDPHERLLVGEVRSNSLQLPRGLGANDERFPEILTRLGVTCVLIGAWGEILRTRILRHPGVWFINCHPSRLPSHRGPNPYSSAVRHGAKDTAVTFHLVDEHIDTGAILAQCPLSIGSDESGGELRARAAALAAKMVENLFSRLSADGISGSVSQSDLGDSSYFSSLSPALAAIPWHRSAPEVHDHVRGIQPWVTPSTKTRDALLRCTVLVTRTVIRTCARRAQTLPGTVIEIEDGTVWVACGCASQDIGLREYRLKLAGITLNTSLSLSAAWRVLTPGVRFVF